MSFRKLLAVVGLLILLPFTIKVFGADFGRSQSLFTDLKAARVGDNLTVLIYELTNANNQSQSKMDESHDASVSGGPGSGALDFIPLFGASSSSSNAYDGKGEVRKSQSLRAKMTVTVQAVRDNGDLTIEGKRSVGIGQNLETMYLTGIVRQKDVRADNTVDSYLIADARITYDGKGPNQNSARPGIITRLLGWLF